MSRKTEIVYGIHAVRHALEHAPGDILEFWVLQGRDPGGEIPALVALAGQASIKVQSVGREAMETRTGDGRHQGVAIRRLVRPPVIADLDQLLASLEGAVPLLLVLDGVQDPHNLGACIRTANAAGVQAVIIPRDRAVQVNATVAKVASGATEYTPVIAVTNLSRALEQLQRHGIWCYGLDAEGDTPLYGADLRGPVALVLGAEGRGLRQNTRKHCDRLFAVPMHGRVESLNVSATTAICLFEAVRQRS